MATATITPELVAEAQEVIDALGRDLVAAEGEVRALGVTPQRINAMFRSGHTLKGLCGMFGLADALALAHALEDVLEAMRMGQMPITAGAINVLLACVDRFAQLIEQAATARPTAAGDHSVRALLDQLGALQGSETTWLEAPTDTGTAADNATSEDHPLSAEMRKMLTEYEEYRLLACAKAGKVLLIAQAQLSLMACDTQLASLEQLLGAQAEIIARLPSTVAGHDATILFDILMATDLPMAAMVAHLQRDDVTLRPLTIAGTPAPPATAPEVLPSPPAGEAATLPPPPGAPSTQEAQNTEPNQNTEPTQALQTVRVDIRRLDSLMHLVGELGRTQSVLQRISATLRQHHGLISLAAELDRESGIMERRISTLQSSVLQARMVPLTALFERLVRVGLSVAAQIGVQVQFVVEGGTTELDKRIVEELADPMLHLVRNAVDHGIAPPSVRLSQNKAAHGTIRLRAISQGSQVVVQVVDDGMGIDVAAVRATAQAKRLLTPERLAEMGQAEVLRLVLMPGFSTRTEVSAYSGRGVGLDVVKTHLEHLGGSVDIATTHGAGTTFSLIAPTTLAIMPALVVAVQGAQYAIPLVHVVETVGIEPAMLRTAHGVTMLEVRDVTLTLTQLSDLLLGRTQPFAAQPQHPGALAGPSYAVVVGGPSRRQALAVDDVIGQQDLVIKPLGPRLAHLRGFAGAAELADRHIILVLDALALTSDAAEVNAVTMEAS